MGRVIEVITTVLVMVDQNVHGRVLISKVVDSPGREFPFGFVNITIDEVDDIFDAINDCFSGRDKDSNINNDLELALLSNGITDRSGGMVGVSCGCAKGNAEEGRDGSQDAKDRSQMHCCCIEARGGLIAEDVAALSVTNLD